MLVWWWFTMVKKGAQNHLQQIPRWTSNPRHPNTCWGLVFGSRNYTWNTKPQKANLDVSGKWTSKQPTTVTGLPFWHILPSATLWDDPTLSIHRPRHSWCSTFLETNDMSHEKPVFRVFTRWAITPLIGVKKSQLRIYNVPFIGVITLLIASRDPHCRGLYYAVMWGLSYTMK